MLTDRQFKTLERQTIIAALFRICDPSGMENLKTGDTVQLKSGGPTMTLGGLVPGTSSTHICHWFYGNELKEGRFRLDELKKADPEQQSQGVEFA